MKKIKIRKSLVFKLVGIIGVVGIVTPLCVAAFTTRHPGAISNYIMRFANTEDNRFKNQYITNIKQKTKQILDDYSIEYKNKYGKNFPGLTLHLGSLDKKAVSSEGIKNFYRNLDRSFQAIDPRLGFEVKYRNNQVVEDVYYNRNCELSTFLWSPDYNSVGTWLAYMFSPEYQLPNLWRPLFGELEKPTPDINGSTQWQTSLKATLKTITLPMYMLENKAIEPYMSFDDMLETVIKYNKQAPAGSQKMSMDSLMSPLANAIGTWITNNSAFQLNPNVQTTIDNEVTNLDFTNINDPAWDGVLKNNESKIIDVGLGIKALDYLTSFKTNIPYSEIGEHSEVPELVREGFYNANNLNADKNYRDWFYKPSILGEGKKTFRFYLNVDPFANTKTPFNPTFNDAASAKFFQTGYTNLTSWSTIGYQNIEGFNLNGKGGGTELVGNGAIIDSEDAKNMLDIWNKPDNVTKKVTLPFKIRAIPWVDTKGNIIKDGDGQIKYLSPEDFYAGFKSYKRAVDYKLSNNGYFLDMAGIDINATLNDPANKQRNTSATDQKVFNIHLQPLLTFGDTLDILQKQPFAALPAFKQSVKNIVDDETFNNLGMVTSNGAIDKLNPNFYQFYGCGDYRKNFDDWAFTGAYYLSSITDQNITWELNPHYFESFKTETKDPKIKDRYKSFNLEYTVPSTKEKFKKIDKVIVKYSDGTDSKVVINQYLANEVDTAELPTSKDLIDMLNATPKSVRSIRTTKASQAFVQAFNLKVFELGSNGVIIGTDGNELISEDGQLKYHLDEWGNYVFDEGCEPKLKSKITKPYYDLIVKDFFTPTEKGGKSATIREALFNLVNWVSLKSLVTPGITMSSQYSFLPYGVHQVPSSTNDVTQQPPNSGKINYWSYIAHRYYMTPDEMKITNENQFLKRKPGLSMWTYDEMLHSIV